MDNTEKQKLVKDIKAISQEAEDLVIISLREGTDLSTAYNIENYIRQQLPKRSILVFVGDIEVKQLTKTDKIRLIQKLIE